MLVRPDVAGRAHPAVLCIDRAAAAQGAVGGVLLAPKTRTPSAPDSLVGEADAAADELVGGNAVLRRVHGPGNQGRAALHALRAGRCGCEERRREGERDAGLQAGGGVGAAQCGGGGRTGRVDQPLPLAAMAREGVWLA